MDLFWVEMLLWVHGFVLGILTGIFLERRKRHRGDNDGQNS